MLAWQGEFRRHDTLGDCGVPVVGGRTLALPRSRYVGEPANDFLHAEDYRQTLVLTHQINECWQVRIGGSSLFGDLKSSQTYAVAQAGETEFARARNDTRRMHEQAYSLIADLAGDIEASVFCHKPLLGMEYTYFDSDSIFAFDSAYPVIDAADPVYANPPAVFTPLSIFRFPAFRQRGVGFYLQDLIELNRHWQLLAGVRFDTMDFTYDRSFFAGTVSRRTVQRFDRVTPRAGVVYQPLPEVLAFYFNYSRSFNPPAGGPYVEPQVLQPELGESFELGSKVLLMEGLSLDIAGFHAVRENAPFLSFPFLIQVGRERSRGVEMNLVGSLTERWSVIANWAYTDTELTDSQNPAVFGQPQRNVPLHCGALWTRYDLIDGCCQTLGAAIGLVAVGRRSADLANAVRLPGYCRWDAGVYYRRGRVSASVYLENLFDTDYAISSVDEFQIFPGAPFNARAQVAVLF